MKRVLLLLFAFLAIISFNSCEKDENNPVTEKILYPSIVKLNGVISTEYIYDNNYLVQRINRYDTLGVFNSYYTYEYSSTNKVKRLLYFDKNDKLTGLYIDNYNNNDLLIKSSYFQSDTATKPLIYTIYEYNSKNQCIKQTKYDGDDIEIYYELSEYNDNNRVQSKIYEGNTLRATMNYIYDNKVNLNKYLSTFTIKYSSHNVTSFTSPDIINNGGTIMSTGQVMLTISRFTFAYLLSNSVYEYNNDYYPTKQTRTYAMKPSKVEVLEYEYLQEN